MNQWLKFVSNFPRTSHLFAISRSPVVLFDEAANALEADLVKVEVYRANVEHVVTNLEYACIWEVISTLRTIDENRELSSS